MVCKLSWGPSRETVSEDKGVSGRKGRILVIYLEKGKVTV